MVRFQAAVALGAMLLAGRAGGAPLHGAAESWRSGSLDGVWTNASYTQFERPDDAKHLIPTPDEAKALSARLAKSHGIDLPASQDPVGQLDSEYDDAGDRLARIRGQLRTSWIVSPVDGQVPYTTEAMRRLRVGKFRPASRYENPEDRPPSERCLFANGSAPPQMSTQDSNGFEIIQTPTQIALYSEKNHDVRTIVLGQRPAHEAQSWTGNSYGRWEGQTLVVETQGFRDGLVDRFWFTYSSAARVTERFTRTGPGEIFYEFQIIDPVMFLEPIKGEMLFEKSAGRLFEYTCHEGNYSLPSILKAARLGKQPEAAPKAAAAAPTP